jgi:hypothetical protein
MPSAALTDAEKQRVAYHMGYPGVTSAASVAFGVPLMTQTNFLIYNVLGHLLDSAIDQVRSISNTMDGIETKLIDAQDRLAATRLEDLYLREDECEALNKQYQNWGYRLSDITGAPVYPYSRRYSGGGGGVTSVPIVRGGM